MMNQNSQHPNNQNVVLTFKTGTNKSLKA